MTVKVRYAPSPTGPLHIGSARTVLYNWLFAKQQGGTVLVRSEDTDLDRSQLKWEQEIGDTLRWLGLEWDEGLVVGGANGPYRQTERLELYRQYLAKLWQGGHVYYCFCTPEELADRRKENQQHGGYDGRCRHLSQEEVQAKLDQGLKPAIRFKVPPDVDIVFHDLIRGRVSVNTRDISDFIIVKNDGIPTYNFAVVVDDVTMGITHVIRANEHLINTPPQILIYRALNQQMPQFAHISLILDESGRKMSKRMGDTAVAAYGRKGYLPEALVNYLALLGWSPEDNRELYTLDELTAAFSLDRVAKSPAVFDRKKLDWMNNQYIMQSNVEKLADLALPLLAEAGFDLASIERDWLALVIEVVRDELSNLAQLADILPQFTGEKIEVETEAMEFLRWETTPMVLDQFTEALKALDVVDRQSVSAVLKQLNKDMKKQAGVGGKAVFMPIRVAISGQTSGQELYHLVPILGRELTLKRIRFSRQQAGI